VKKKIFSGMISATITLIMAIAMITIIYATMSANNKDIFGYRIFVVATGSMKGTINEGDLIVTKKVATDTLKIKDIITFISIEESIYGKVNTHRIFGIDKSAFITKGDANSEKDDTPVTADRIIGKVIYHSAFLGFILKTLSKSLNMLLFIFLPIAFMAITDFRRAKNKAKKALKEERDKDACDQTENSKNLDIT